MIRIKHRETHVILLLAFFNTIVLAFCGGCAIVIYLMSFVKNGNIFKKIKVGMEGSIWEIFM
jgi:hypothetical protein